MTTISANPQIASTLFTGVSSTAPSNAEKTSAPLRPASSAVALQADSETKSVGGADLRKPLVDTDEVKGFAGLLAMLIGMLNELMLQDSKRIESSSGLEVKLAAGRASNQRDIGQTQLIGGASQAAAMMTTTAVGSYRTIAGSNTQINSHKSNFAASTENQRFATAGNRTPQALSELNQRAGSQSLAHSTQMAKGAKLQTQGNAVKDGGMAVNNMLQATKESGVSMKQAAQAELDGETSVAARTTELTSKGKSQTEDTQRRLFSIQETDNRSKSDTESHVAQNTR